MKRTVTRACGHEQEVEVFGAREAREAKISWYERTDCTECYEKSQNKGSEEVEMSYREYKENYSNCNTKKDSYDKKTKTIIVFVPKKEEVKEEVAEVKETELTTEEIVNIIAPEFSPRPTEEIKKFVETGSEALIKNAEVKGERLKKMPIEINGEQITLYDFSERLIAALKKYGR